jgi:hypothetical protein
MDQSKVRPMTPEERAKWEQSLADYTAERPAIDAMMKSFRAAASEDSFSGHVRKVIHQSRIPLPSICRQAGIEWETLRAFLAGESPLPSDVIDRIAQVVRFDVVTSGQ